MTRLQNILPALLFLLLSGNIFCQSKFNLIAEGGASLLSISNNEPYDPNYDGSYSGTYALYGGYAAIRIQRNISLHSYFESGICLVQKGKYTWTESNLIWPPGATDYFEERYRLTYLEVPVHYGIQLTQHKWRPYIEFGLNATILVSAHRRVHWKRPAENFDYYHTNNYMASDTFKMNWLSADAQVEAGVVGNQRFRFAIGYTLGPRWTAIEVLDSPNDYSHEFLFHTFTIKAGYFFLRLKCKDCPSI